MNTSLMGHVEVWEPSSCTDSVDHLLWKCHWSSCLDLLVNRIWLHGIQW